jgi:hypothetical protein
MCGITIVSVISFELFKHRGKQKIWNYGNVAARFVFPLRDGPRESDKVLSYNY